MAGRGRIRIDWPTAAGAMMFILMGGGFATFGGWQLKTTYEFLGNATEISAEVVENSENCDSDDGCTWWPTVEFTLDSGETLQRDTQFGSSAYGYSEGADIDILYNSDFSYIRIPGGSNLWLLGGAFFGLGFPVCLIGIWLLARWTVSRESKDPPDS